MARRSTSRFQLDNRAFPIRVLVRNLSGDALALRLTAAEVWLNENVGRGEWAMHGQSRIGLHAMGFYFRQIEAAEAFLDAHPHLELEDTTGQLQHVVAARRASCGGRFVGTSAEGSGEAVDPSGMTPDVL